MLRGERKLNSASAPSVKARRRFWKVLARQPSAPRTDPTTPDRLRNVAEQGGTGRENQAHRRVAVIHAVPKCSPSRTELAQRVTRRTVVQKMEPRCKLCIRRPWSCLNQPRDVKSSMHVSPGLLPLATAFPEDLGAHPPTGSSVPFWLWPCDPASLAWP